MKESKHTPGPWAWELCDQYDMTRRIFVRSCGPHPVTLSEAWAGHAPGARIANAKLMAAAPDMLAALKALLDDHVKNRRAGQYNAGLVRQARTAIETATE